MECQEESHTRRALKSFVATAKTLSFVPTLLIGNFHFGIYCNENCRKVGTKENVGFYPAERDIQQPLRLSSILYMTGVGPEVIAAGKCHTVEHHAGRSSNINSTGKAMGDPTLQRKFI